MLVVLGIDQTHIVKPGTDVTFCGRKIPLVVQGVTVGKATCEECNVELIKSCDIKAQERIKGLMKAERARSKAFYELSEICDHRDLDKKHCRHESLKCEADAKGISAFQNGCFRQICPLLKKD